MIKRTAKYVLGLFLRRFRTPFLPGLIDIADPVSGATLKLHWRNDGLMETAFFRHGLYGSWERHSLKLWAHVSAEATEILDIGANTGIYSLLARKNNARATIVAVEPVPINADVLQANVDANAANVLVERLALSDALGEAEMFMLKDRLNYMTSVNEDRYAQHPDIARTTQVVAIKVPTADWSELQRRCSLRGPDLIKIDVEGHETHVLRSMLPHVKAGLPTMLVEIIGDSNGAQLDAMLAGLGYRYFAIDERAARASRVDRLWDNDHQNFLICTARVADALTRKGLIDPVLKT